MTVPDAQDELYQALEDRGQTGFSGRSEQVLAPPAQLHPAAPHDRSQALSLLYHRHSPQQRESLYHWARRLLGREPQAFAGLYVAKRGGLVRGAAWGLPVGGRQVRIWLPVLAPGERQSTRGGLLDALDLHIARHVDQAGAHVAYATFRPGQRQALVEVTSRQFRYIADLGRMVCSLDRSAPLADADLAFECYQAADAARLKALIQRTTEESFDCPAMRGVRNIDDVLDGHFSKADYEPTHWRIIRHRRRDVGCLLVSRHKQRPECEVVYLGLVPEARGRGWGTSAIRHAQQLARSAGASQLWLGCDVNNPPALQTYRRGRLSRSQPLVCVRQGVQVGSRMKAVWAAFRWPRAATPSHRA